MSKDLLTPSKVLTISELTNNQNLFKEPCWEQAHTALRDIQYAVRLLLESVNAYKNHNIEDIEDTPKRAAKMFLELLQGEFVTNEQIAEAFGKNFDFTEKHKTMLVTKDIECFSMCEHHLALMYDMKVSIGYIPKNGILGLSKFARIVDIVSRRLQTQEKMGSDIVDVLQRILGEDTPILVLIEAKHSCMTARGIQKPGSYTKTLSTSDAVAQGDIELFYKLLEVK